MQFEACGNRTRQNNEAIRLNIVGPRINGCVNPYQQCIVCGYSVMTIVTVVTLPSLMLGYRHTAMAGWFSYNVFWTLKSYLDCIMYKIYLKSVL